MISHKELENVIEQVNESYSILLERIEKLEALNILKEESKEKSKK